jgi:glucose-1-phosphate thymidylyltransferase
LSTTATVNPDTAKAVILARGLGTRMRREEAGAALDPDQARMAERGLKAMIPIRRPFLDYVLSSLADAGSRDICLVIGPEHDVVRDYYERRVGLERIRLAFAIQEEPRGTADAVAAAATFAGDDHFLMLNSDNYYPVEACRALRVLGQPGLVGFDRNALVREGHIDAERVRAYALLQVSRDGILERIVEKPDLATFASFGAAAPVSLNLWRFGPRIFQACAGIGPSSRGELELSTAVQFAIDRLGERFRVVPFRGSVLDLSRRADVASVAKHLEGMEARL